jgi:hypothetical protein
LLKIYFHWIIHTKANDSRMRCGINNSRWHTTDKWTLGPCSTDICPQARGRRNTQKKICTRLPDFPNMLRPFLRDHLQGYFPTDTNYKLCIKKLFCSLVSKHRL